MTVYGWDISNHDWDRHHVHLADARKAGISFVTHKATEGCPAAGNAYVDPYFGDHASNALGDSFAKQLPHVDFPVAGSYHATHAGHAIAQADFWFDTVAAKYSGWRNHPCWIWQIDAEPLDGYPAPSKADILAIGARIEHRAGCTADRILVYGPHWVYEDRLAGIPYRLWASNYTNRGRSFKSLYPGDKASNWAAYSGQSPLVLQYSSGAVIGAQGTCDANAVRVPDEAALVRLFKPTPTPPPPPPGPTPPPAPLPLGRNPDMIVVRIDPTTVPKGATWPGWFTFDGQHLAHIVHTANGTAVLAACGQTAPAEISYDQYTLWSGK